MPKPSTRVLLLACTLLAGVVLPARADLTHRYSFTSDASDSIGAAHGTLEGAAAVSDGAVVLDGADAYVNLPGGLIQGYTAATIEAWTTMAEGPVWTRLFDFGATNGANGHHYVFFTPHSGAADTRLVISDTDPGWAHEELVAQAGFLDDGNPVHVAAVLDPAKGWGAFYVNGRLAAWSQNISIPLSQVAPDYCFLGKSLYSADAYLTGTIDEFRIHNSALGSAEIAQSFATGPAALNYDPGPVAELALALPAQVRLGGVVIPELTGTFATLGQVTLGPLDVTLRSSAPGVVTVQTNGNLIAKAVGTATITAERDGKSATAVVTVLPAPVVLMHRYSFNEPAGSVEVVDSVGGANGSVNPAAEGPNTVGLGTGQAVFPGGSTYRQGGYIDLPDGIVSSKTNITFEVWATWNGPSGSTWQRIFDFGSSSKGNDPHASGNGTGSFFLTPRGGAGVVRFDAAPTGFANERILDGTATLPVGRETHIVCIYAPANQSSQLWIDGKLVRSSTAPFPLANLQDANCWLGLANWNDPPLNGALNEFRIYEGALTELEIALRRQAGPNTIPTDPGLLESISLQAPTLLQGNRVAAQAALLANFQKSKNVDISGLDSVTFTSTDPNIFTVAAGGGLLPVNLGSALLIGSYQGRSATSAVSVVAATRLTLTLPSPALAGGAATSAILMAEFPGTNANVAAFAGVTFASSATNVASIDATGTLLPLRVGTTTISASYAGLNASDTLRVALPAGYQAARLIHRYSFNEAPGATEVLDSVGGANGELVNPSPSSDFTGTGRLKLQGGAWNAAVQSGYVNLPNGLISGLTDASIEGWIRWAGPSSSSWQRIFDFGRNSATDAEGNPLEDAYVNPGLSYMFLSPRSGNNTFRFAIKQGAGPEQPVLDSTTLPVNQDVHFALVYDAAAGGVRLYRDGRRVQTGLVTHPLSVVEDLNVYLGRSQWTDPYFAGEFDEFRIYAGALQEDEVAVSFAAGANTLPDFTPAPRLAVSLAGALIELSWPAEATGFVLEASDQLPAVSWVPVSGVVNNRVAVPADRNARFYRLRK